jgi:hypothetical protein
MTPNRQDAFLEDAAREFEKHAATCAVCASDGIDVCKEGLRLMYRFQDALHYSVTGAPLKKGEPN